MIQQRPAVTEASGTVGLRRGAIGLREVLFQSITAMAPGAAIAASIPAGAAFAGGSLPLAVLLALVACLFTAFAIAELARHLPAAGGVATYTSQGLHPGAGFLVGWGYVFVQALVPPLLFLQLGFTTAATVHDQFPSISADLWWPWVIVGAIIVFAAGYFGIRASARFGTILGAFEILVFVILAVLMIGNAGSHNTVTVFSTAYTPSTYPGIAGVLAGSVYTILAFSGFEAAAPLAEEAVNPKRNIRLAVVGATLIIGLVYIVTTYAVDVAVGPDRFSAFSGSGDVSWLGVAKGSYGLFWVLVFFAIVNSTLANANAGATASTRTAFALSRIQLVPSVLSRIHSQHRSPHIAVFVQFLVAVAVAIGLGALYGPTTAFLLIATVLVLVVVGVYILCDLACIGFYLRRRREDFNPLLHVLVPVLGIAAFLPALLTTAGIQAFSFISALTAPVSYAGVIVGVWMVLGLIYLGYLWTRHPDRVRQVSQIHLVDELDEHERAISA